MHVWVFLRGGGTTSGPAIPVESLQPPLSCVIDGKDEYIVIHLAHHRSWGVVVNAFRRDGYGVGSASGGAFWSWR